MKKTLPLLLAGLLAAGGAMAQSGSGDTSMTTQPGSPSQSLNSNSGGVPSNLPGSGGTAMPSASATSADSASSTSVMGAGPSTTVVVPVVPVAVVPATPVATVDEPRFGRGNVGSRAVDTGNGTLEGNGGPYDDGWWGPRPVYVFVPR